MSRNESEDNERERQRIGLRIRDARVRRGWSQDQLAKALGTHRPTISVIEGGKQSVRAEQLSDFARALKCTVDDLL